MTLGNLNSEAASTVGGNKGVDPLHYRKSHSIAKPRMAKEHVVPGN